jgi:acetylglutamate kinase
MRLVIKLAGALLDEPNAVARIAQQVARLARDGHQMLVIHGGGKIFTATLARMGIESRFIHGLRVTDRATRDAAVMVFAGLLNKRLAAAISREGVNAVGISAADASCFTAEPMQVNGDTSALGFVGYITSVSVGFIESLWRAGLVPVACCLGKGGDGELYNINADHMAAACAEFLDADRLIFLTDVAGVLVGDAVLSAVCGEEIEDLIRTNKVSGGMVLKLEACKRALNGGVRQVRIVGGAVPDALLQAANGARFPGTRVRAALRASRRRKTNFTRAAFTAAKASPR